MKKFISLLLVVCVFCCSTMFSANAMPAPMRYGDANFDFEIDITDATYIQLYLVDYETMDRGQYELADVDDDGEISILDATMVQKKIAKIIDKFPAGVEIDDYYYEIKIHLDSEGWYPVVGETVTFTVEGKNNWMPMTYQYYIDDEHICTSESNVLSYTFDKAGGYDLDVYTKNALDFSQHWQITVSVKEAPINVD